MKQKPRTHIAKMPLVSRKRLDQLARLGPWDTEKDWGPTEAMVARAARNKPFWASWESEAIQSIQEIHRVFELRAAGSLAIGFNPERMPGHASPNLSPEDQEAYDHFTAWLEEMRHAGLKTYINMVRDVLLLEEGTKEPGIFRRAINLHVRCRS